MQQQLATLPVVAHELCSATQEVGGRVLVISPERTHASRTQVRGGTAAERAGQVIGQAELGSIALPLLQVVCDDLLVLDEPVAGNSLEPVGEAGVKVSALLFRERCVGGVANQEMAEAKRLIASRAGAIRTDELLADQRHESRSQVVATVRRRQLCYGGTLEDLADHRSAPDQVSFERLEMVQPRGYQRRDARWDRDVLKVLDRLPTAILAT